MKNVKYVKEGEVWRVAGDFLTEGTAQGEQVGGREYTAIGGRLYCTVSQQEILQSRRAV